LAGACTSGKYAEFYLETSLTTYLIRYIIITFNTKRGCKMKNHKFKAFFGFVILLLLSNIGIYADVEVTITSLSFSPQDGSYNLHWPKPRRPWRNSDKEYYNIYVRLRNPAPCNITLYFYIKQNRRFWPDKILGTTSVTIQSGSSRGTGQFWLVCTKKGKVKGNENKNGNKASVYLEPFRTFYPSSGCPDIYLDFHYSRPEHSCKCR
jgi:hypothetical protein